MRQIINSGNEGDIITYSDIKEKEEKLRKKNKWQFFLSVEEGSDAEKQTLGTAVDKQGQKTGKHGGREFHWWAINVDADGCKGRI